MPNTVTENIKKYKKFADALILPAIVALVGMGAFGLGRLSMTSERPKLVIRDGEGLAAVAAPAAAVPASQQAQSGEALGQKTYVASKSGSKYYLPNCAGAKSIKEENKVWFTSSQDAQAAGYEPAANCKGL